MDWKYILSITPEDLNDDEKDELYNTVTWFECDSEEVDLEKCKVLIKVSQEILKYKGEQVETLLHELEEMAIQQGEEEARKLESDTDARSSKSRRSSSIEYENLEHKYMELKAKCKKLVKINEKHNSEVEKLNSRIRNLEQENRRLQNEIQTRPQDGSSESDLSETIRDQQRELVETISNKNKQISDLLRDIEEVEQDNLVLREKLSKVRDELATATNEITTMTDTLKDRDAALDENEESLKKLSIDYEKLQSDFEELLQEKTSLEQEMKEFAEEVDARVDEWKKIIDEKNAEIEQLKTHKDHEDQTSIRSSLSSLPKDDLEKPLTSALQRTLSEREKQLLEVQTQLQIATKEMEESTKIIQKLKLEREKDTSKIKELHGVVQDSKKQLKTVYERCQNLQDELTFAENVVASKELELNRILSKMKENGQIELALQIEEIQNLKSDNRIKEKQIISLVKTSNKLQDTCDYFEKENYVLRERLGIPEDEQINLHGYVSKQKKQKKEVETLKKELSKKEEECITLKSEMHKLNKIASSLTNQIVELGQKPIYNLKSGETVDVNIKKENKAFAEENEALRKGLHEILNSINIKKSSTLKEIKSETLEQLLRALDVKHISGWYHPAMRLQAELHNLEGINAELREQLREARLKVQQSQVDETDKIKEDTKLIQEDLKPVEIAGEDLEKEKEIELLYIKESSEDGLQETLDNAFKKIIDKSKTMTEIEVILRHFENALCVIQQQIIMLFKEIVVQKKSLEDIVTSKEDFIQNLQNNIEISEAKLKVFQESIDEERFKKVEEIVGSNIALQRKNKFLETEIRRLEMQIENLNNNLSNAEISYTKKVEEFSRENIALETNLKVLRNLNDISVDYEVFQDVKKDLDNMTIKYRQLAIDIKSQKEENSIELTMLQESQTILEKDKEELRSKLTEVLSKLALQTVQNVDDKIEKLSQKLAECEVIGITERQRANHTNNLYELVKEQLNKSEERFQEYSKYNEELMKKNLILQEQLKEAEDNLSNYVDRELHKHIQNTNNNLLKENEKLETMVSKLEEDLKITKKTSYHQKSWNDCKEQELLNLKHQIVDLISVSDEKMIISHLNSDLLYCKQSENFYKTRLEQKNEEIKLFEEKLQKIGSKYELDKMEAIEKELQLNKKIGVLQNLLSKQKRQYLGCLPLSSEEIYLDTLRTINREKHETFINNYKTKIVKTETDILKEQLNIEMQNLIQQKQMLSEGEKEEFKNALNWMQEKKNLQINELRYRRQAEYKELQLQHIMERVKIQDEQISKLDEELLLWHKNFDILSSKEEATVIEAKETTGTEIIPVVKVMKTEESQTSEVALEETEDRSEESNQISSLKTELIRARDDVEEKEQNINQLKSKITELEMTISMFRKQIGDKQSQISFYERHILELQSKKEEVHSNGAGGDNITVGADTIKDNKEVLALKASIKNLQESLKSKEEHIIQYQTLLKVDRDKHSLAAASLQEELQNLQKILSDEKKKRLSLEETFSKSKPHRAAIEQYMKQVHALEQHTSELHTKISSLEVQLQSARQEAVRWRSLANDRLAAMEELRKSLEEQHRNELSIYKTDSEKLKELGNDEKNNLKQLITKHKSECTGHLDQDIQKLIREKDDKIYELTTKLRQIKNESKRLAANEKLEGDVLPKLSDLESSRELLLKEHDLLKKRYEQLLNKERSARDEIRELKMQLLKKPSTARTDKSEKTIKEQLQRKISLLENEIVDLKQSLTEQISINESHRVQATEDFERWKKMKHWQQSSEKLKNKLKERDNEYEKLQQTCAGYRLLIERLEREKHNLENRIRNLKSSNINAANSKEAELLRIENFKLMADLEALHSKLEMQQHHSGGLGAAMLQEKLEGQERKIAVLELAAKGPVEVRAELERLQDAFSSLQKKNLCLEAENLDLKLDLEKSNKEVPHLQQQIHHLENYVDVLKAENSKQELGNNATQPTNTESKKVPELERTVFILKRVVEKLQVENKRLMSGKRPFSDRSGSADKLKRDYARLKEQHAESLQKVGQLEQELTSARNKMKSTTNKPDNDNVVALSDELSRVKEQLEQKSHLLDKVKVLLHRAAAKEKTLLQEISELKQCQQEAGISPIPEESEDSSADI